MFFWVVFAASGFLKVFTLVLVSGPFLHVFLSSGVKTSKKMTINRALVIEKLGLPAGPARFNLQMSDSSDISWVTSPGLTGSNHLLPPHCETMTLSFAKPDGMGITSAISPDQSN